MFYAQNKMIFFIVRIGKFLQWRATNMEVPLKQFKKTLCPNLAYKESAVTPFPNMSNPMPFVCFKISITTVIAVTKSDHE